MAHAQALAPEVDNNIRNNEQSRISVRLNADAKEALERIMRLGKLRTIQDAILRAIGDEVFLQDQMSEGWKVLLQKDNKYREVVWPRL